MSMKDFQIISRLGEGSYSSVWKVKRKSDGQEYAMKKVKLSTLNQKEKENALNEVRILASIKNPHIISYKEAFLDDNATTLCIIMEYAAGGDTYQKIQALQKTKQTMKESDVWRIFYHMIKGLKVLHQMKIMHRDLKCANIFMSKDNKTIKLGDLNVSKVVKNSLAHTQTGTPYYASPEVWRDQPYDSKSDIWSLGCVIYEICALKPPFRANDMNGLYRKVQKGVYDRIPASYSSDLFQIISMCIQVSPSMRPSTEQLLKHPLIQKHCKDFDVSPPATLTSLSNDNQLLSTIRVPKNIKQIGKVLPKSNYDLDDEESKLPRLIDRSASQMTPNAVGNGLKAISPINKPQSREGPAPSSNLPINRKPSHEQIDYLIRKELGGAPINGNSLLDKAHNLYSKAHRAEDYNAPASNPKPPSYKMLKQQSRLEEIERDRSPLTKRQAYLIQKYGNKGDGSESNRRGGDYSNKKKPSSITDSSSVLSRRGEQVLAKYTPQSLKEISPSGGLNIKKEHLNEIQQMEAEISKLKNQYDNINYGKVNVSPYQKIDYQYQNKPTYEIKKLNGGASGAESPNIFRDDSNSTNDTYLSNQIKSNNDLQQRGVTRPVWWG